MCGGENLAGRIIREDADIRQCQRVIDRQHTGRIFIFQQADIVDIECALGLNCTAVNITQLDGIADVKRGAGADQAFLVNDVFYTVHDQGIGCRQRGLRISQVFNLRHAQRIPGEDGGVILVSHGVDVIQHHVITLNQA